MTDIIGFVVGDVRHLCEPRARKMAARILRDIRSPACRQLDNDYEYRMGEFCAIKWPASLPPWMRAALLYAQWRVAEHYGYAGLVAEFHRR
jgi:hypothetical protein